MSDFNKIIARRQHDLIANELQRLVGPSEPPESKSSSSTDEIVASALPDSTSTVEIVYIYQVSYFC